MIRKKVIGKTARTEDGWSDLSQCAAFEVTSEEPGSPLENALTPDAKKWIAATPGEQVVRITFDEPQNISKIFLLFEETANARSQEFVLLWQQVGQPQCRRSCGSSSNSAHQRPLPKAKTSTSPSKERALWSY
jgi:hypothetical protein